MTFDLLHELHRLDRAIARGVVSETALARRARVLGPTEPDETAAEADAPTTEEES